MKKRTHTVVILIVITILIVFIPLFWLQGAQFEGSDSAGSEMVDEVTGEEYEPWFNPVLETLIGGKLPSEIETLFFCIQTGIGVGIIAFSFGYLAARKKYGGESENEKQTIDTTMQGV